MVLGMFSGANASMAFLCDHLKRAKEVGSLHDENSDWTTQTIFR